jgi:hypothetical protein
MAIKKTIEIDVNANAAEKDINDLNKSVIGLDKSVDELGKSGKKSLDNIDKNLKETEKSTKSLSEGFKATGVALKAMGIGLVISLMATLKEIFTSNQKVADTFSAVLGTVANVFSQVTNVVVSVIEKVGGASKGFEGLTAVIGGLLKLGITPLKAAFFGIKLVIDEVRLAWEQSLFGDDDPKTIKELTKRIEETKTSLKKVGTDAVEAGKQVGNNIGKAISEVGAVVEGAIDGVSKISIASAYEQSKANIQLQNTAKLAEANQARLVEQYDRQAEKLRQVRDEERNSVEDRIKANNQLKDVLENQQAAMLAQAAAQIAAAQSTLAQNNNIENQVALTNALANREGVLAQVEGLRSEQKANDLSLNKELIDLTKTKQEAETELAINEANFNAERIKNEELQLQAKKDALEQNKIIELERLQSVIDGANAGTQARVDAENEFALKKQEIDQQIILAEDAIAEQKRTKKVEEQQVLIDNEYLLFETRRNALIEQERLLLEDKTLSEAQRNAILKQFSDSRIKLDQAEADQKLAIQNAVLDNVAGGIGVLKQLGEKNKGLQKAAIIAENAVGIARIILNTQAANAKSVAASPLTGGFPWVAVNTIGGALGVASSLLATKKALSELGGGSVSSPSVGGGGGGGQAAAPTPQFNVVGNTGINQVAATLGQQQPVQAFVVANQVTSQQALDRSIVNNASLG